MRRRGSGTPNAAALASSLSPLPPLLASPSLTHLAVPAVVLTAMRGSMAVLSLSTPWGERERVGGFGARPAHPRHVLPSTLFSLYLVVPNAPAVCRHGRDAFGRVVRRPAAKRDDAVALLFLQHGQAGFDLRG